MHSGEGAKKKGLGAGREGEETLLSLSLPIPFFRFFPLRSIYRHSPLSEHALETGKHQK